MSQWVDLFYIYRAARAIFCYQQDKRKSAPGEKINQTRLLINLRNKDMQTVYQ